MNRKRRPNFNFSRKRPIYVFTQERGWVHGRATKEDASTISRYWNAIKRYLNYGNIDGLVELQGAMVRVGGHHYTLETNLSVIDDMASAGELDFDDIYEETE